MKKIFPLLSLLLVCLSAFAQSEQGTRIFTGKCAVSQTGSGAGYWEVTVTNFNDPSGQLDASEIQVNDFLYLTDAGTTVALKITVRVSAMGSGAVLRVSNAGITAISSVPTTSNAFISRRSVNKGFTPIVANLSSNDNQLQQEYTLYKIDSLINLGTSSGANWFKSADNFATFSPSTPTPVNGDFCVNTRTGGWYQRSGGAFTTKVLADNGTLVPAASAFVQSANSLTFDAALYNRAKVSTLTSGTTITINSPTNIATQTISEIFLIEIQNNNDSACTINWNSVFGAWGKEGTALSTTIAAGSNIGYTFECVTDGAEGVVLSSLNDLGQGCNYPLTYLANGNNSITTAAAECATFLKWSDGSDTVTISGTPVAGSKFYLIDRYGNFAANPVVVKVTSGTIRGATTITLAKDAGVWLFTYQTTDNRWDVGGEIAVAIDKSIYADGDSLTQTTTVVKMTDDPDNVQQDILIGYHPPGSFDDEFGNPGTYGAYVSPYYSGAMGFMWRTGTNDNEIKIGPSSFYTGLRSTVSGRLASTSFLANRSNNSYASASAAWQLASSLNGSGNSNVYQVNSSTTNTNTNLTEKTNLIKSGVRNFTNFRYMKADSALNAASQVLQSRQQLTGIYDNLSENWNLASSNAVLATQKIQLDSIGTNADGNYYVGLTHIKVNPNNAQFNNLGYINGTGIPRWSLSRQIGTTFASDFQFVDVKLQDTTANAVKLYEKYSLYNGTPSVTNGVVSAMTWTGTGSTSTPGFTDISGAASAAQPNEQIAFGNSTGTGLTSSSSVKYTNASLTVTGTAGFTSQAFSNTAGVYPRYVLARSRGSSGSPTVVQQGTTMGEYVFQGHNGTAMTQVASTVGLIDSLSGTTLSGKLEFRTYDMAGSNVSRLTLKNNGDIILPFHPNTRDDYSTSSPTNILYTSGGGYMRSTKPDSVMVLNPLTGSGTVTLARALRTLYTSGAGLTFTNGLTNTAGTVRLGGTLTQSTNIAGGDFDLTASGIKILDLESDTLTLKVNGQKFIHMGSMKGAAYNYDEVAIGYRAGANLPAYNSVANTLVGSYAGENLNGTATNGASNALFGYTAGQPLTTGSFNSLFGVAAGSAMGVTAMSNTAVGHHACLNCSGNQNNAFGQYALQDNTATNSSAFGWETMRFNTSGNQNSAFGTQALKNNLTGGNNTAVGFQALFANTGGSNTAVGTQALATNTSGTQNTAIGYLSLNANATTNNHTGIGYLAGQFAIPSSSTEGVTFVGANAGTGQSTLSTGNSLTGIGWKALSVYTTALEGTAVGAGSMDVLTTGNYNTAIGTNSLGTLTTGANNTAVGRASGNGITTGNNNVLLGFNTVASSASASNEMNLAQAVYGTSVLGTNASVGINDAAPDRTFHVVQNSALTNAVGYVEKQTHNTSGTATTGFGVGEEVELETSTGAQKVVYVKETTYTDATNGSEDISIDEKIVVNGTLTNMLKLSAADVTLGLPAGTGTVNIAASTGSQTLNLATGTGPQTVNIATGGGSAKGVHIADGALANGLFMGSTTGAAATYVSGGTVGVLIGNGSATNVSVGESVTTGQIHIGKTSLGDSVKLYNKYKLPNATPSTTSGVVSTMTWTGTGSAATPGFGIDLSAKTVSLDHTGFGTAVTTGEATSGFEIPAELNGWKIVEVSYRTFGNVTVAGLDAQIKRQTSGGSAAGTLAGTVATSTRFVKVTGSYTVNEGDLIYLDVPSIGMSIATGLTATIVLKP